MLTKTSKKCWWILVFVIIFFYMTTVWKKYNKKNDDRLLVRIDAAVTQKVPTLGTTGPPFRISTTQQIQCQKSGHFNQNITFSIKPTFHLNETCGEYPCISIKKIKWHMMTFVKSAAGNIQRRELIRRTWASLKYVEGGRFDTIFVVGQVSGPTQALLEAEAKRNGDILQIDEEDGYQNVVMKTLAGMQWASENLSDHFFYSSADDDMMINLGKVQEEIALHLSKVTSEELPEFPIICTYGLEESSRPMRHPQNKNYVSREQYRWPFWPKFCLGGMYTTSMRVTRQLWKISRNVKPLNTDDVWITGILRQKLGLPNQMVVPVVPTPVKHFSNFSGKDGDYAKSVMQSHWKEIYDLLEQKEKCQCIH